MWLSILEVEKAMSILLHIDSSPVGEESISRRLTREFARRWRLANPQGQVITRDLATTHIPVIDAKWIAANYAPAESRNQQQRDLLALSTELSSEMMDAGEYVIGVPMHNWGPSASLKLWADQIVRFGRTMLITPTGLKGTLDKKRATFFVTAGRSYDLSSGNAAKNHLEPWLRTFFGGLGVRDMRVVFVDHTAQVRNGRIALDAFLAPHLEAMQSLFLEPVSSTR
jgi:FMN-dependent NADH-azoreductase